MKVNISYKMRDVETWYVADDAVLVETDINDTVSVLQIVCAEPYWINGEQSKDRILRLCINCITSLIIE